MQWLWWLCGAFVLGLVEVMTVDFTFLMLAVGALGACVAAAFGAVWWVCVIVFVVVSIIMLAAVRPFMLSHLKRKGDGEPQTGAAALVGREAVTVTAVTATGGRVKLEGEVWTARIEGGVGSVPAGSFVEVSAIDGATAVVRPKAQAQAG
ncbi:MAG: NfeD family protein [Bifidobacteriaceae bacterium]|jgi:membrane protein implicated in regulation of membrane protease activity|nr:NfeD family protein [Bifidobacteriaceae bacterium]